MKTIVAMCGLAGSGKDTACDYLVSTYGFKKLSFAAPLKQMAKIAFGFSDEQLYGSSEHREEQNIDYPLNGECVHCGHACIKANEEPEEFTWHCSACDHSYPQFINARIVLQTLGTEWGRRLCSDIWAKAAVNQILSSDHNLWCLSDLRFRNELDAVHAAGGHTIRLMRGSAKTTHASETELLTIPLPDFSHVVYNLTSKSDLFWSLDRALESIRMNPADSK